jgi:hypothetical protein
MAWFRPDAPCRNASEVTLSRYASPRNRAIGRGAINDLGVRAGTCEPLEQPRRAAFRFPTDCQPKRRRDPLLPKCQGKSRFIASLGMTMNYDFSVNYAVVP